MHHRSRSRSAMAAIYAQVTVNDMVIARYTADAWRGRVFAVRYFLTFLVSGAAVSLIALLHGRGGFDLVLAVDRGHRARLRRSAPLRSRSWSTASRRSARARSSSRRNKGRRGARRYGRFAIVTSACAPLAASSARRYGHLPCSESIRLSDVAAAEGSVVSDHDLEFGDAGCTRTLSRSWSLAFWGYPPRSTCVSGDTPVDYSPRKIKSVFFSPRLTSIRARSFGPPCVRTLKSRLARAALRFRVPLTKASDVAHGERRGDPEAQVRFLSFHPTRG